MGSADYRFAQRHGGFADKAGPGLEGMIWKWPDRSSTFRCRVPGGMTRAAGERIPTAECRVTRVPWPCRSLSPKSARNPAPVCPWEHTPPACRFRRPAGNLDSRKSTQSGKDVAGKGSGTKSRPGRSRQHAGRGAFLSDRVDQAGIALAGFPNARTPARTRRPTAG